MTTFVISTGELLKVQGRVLVALMLRDIRTRFGHGIGFLVAIGWPLTHILAIVGMFSVAGREPPFGESAALWIATGTVPFMCFSYMSRFIMYGIVFNRQLLVFPAVKIFDILFARAILEALSAVCVILILAILFWIYDVDFIPLDIVQACFALGACMLIGLGFGVINAILATAVPMWITGYTLFTILLWVGSGVLFVADTLPEPIRNVLAYNPALHGVEWMRSAYYEGYGSVILDKPYMIACGLVTLFIGLVLERLVRGRLLQ